MSNDNTETTPPAAVDEANVPETPVAPEPQKVEANNERIRDEFAYWKSQAEKLERLNKKNEAAANDAKAQLDTFQTEQAKEINDKIAKLQNELETQRAAAEAARIEAVKVKLLIDAGLDTDMIEFISSDDPDKINEQIAKLAARVSQRGGRIGNAANEAANDLSWLPGHPTYKGGTFGN